MYGLGNLGYHACPLRFSTSYPSLSLSRHWLPIPQTVRARPAHKQALRLLILLRPALPAMEMAEIEVAALGRTLHLPPTVLREVLQSAGAPLQRALIPRVVPDAAHAAAVGAEHRVLVVEVPRRRVRVPAPPAAADVALGRRVELREGAALAPVFALDGADGRLVVRRVAVAAVQDAVLGQVGVLRAVRAGVLGASRAFPQPARGYGALRHVAEHGADVCPAQAPAARLLVEFREPRAREVEEALLRRVEPVEPENDGCAPILRRGRAAGPRWRVAVCSVV